MPGAPSNQSAGSRSLVQSDPGAGALASACGRRSGPVESPRAPASRGPRCPVPSLSPAGAAGRTRGESGAGGDGECAGRAETGKGWFEPAGTGWKRPRAGVSLRPPGSPRLPALGRGVGPGVPSRLRVGVPVPPKSLSGRGPRGRDDPGWRSGLGRRGGGAAAGWACLT